MCCKTFSYNFVMCNNLNKIVHFLFKNISLSPTIPAKLCSQENVQTMRFMFLICSNLRHQLDKIAWEFRDKYNHKFQYETTENYILDRWF